MIAEIYDSEYQVVTSTPLDFINKNVDMPSGRAWVNQTFPKTNADAPELLPQNVLRYYNQATKNERSEDWDAAGAMFRKALDVATKTLDPALAPKNLYQRIESLGASGKLTDDLVKWAHEVRVDGNAAVHDDDPETQGDVEAMHQFTRAFLTYAFTLPAFVARRSSAAGSGTPSSAA